MKGDFTRDTLDATRHFTRVLFQQGRVQLDSDLNELGGMLLRYLQALAADLIGPHGGPEANTGFEIMEDSLLEDDFFIGPGRYYVDGILCELDPGFLAVSPVPNQPAALKSSSLTLDGRSLVSDDWIEIADNQDARHRRQISSVDFEKGTFTVKGTLPDHPVRIRRLMTFRGQPDYPGTQKGPEGTRHLAYLDVWERHITHLDDSHIREVALGGPDTATRAQVVWQVKLMRADDCSDVGELLTLSSARMRARLKREDPASDPCILPPDSRFRGAENQLYRVEIHEVKPKNNDQEQEWTFKWSRENASVEAIWLDTNGDGGLTVSSTRGFAEEQWVEVTSETGELRGEPGQMCKIVRIDGSSIFVQPQPARYAESTMKVRCWDQRELGDTQLRDGAVIGKSGEWLDLENGIEVYFEEGGVYHPGDYWLIPARAATGRIEWPWEMDKYGRVRKDADGNEIPVARKPQGVEHHYAPLALLTWTRNRVEISQDCRCSFQLTKTCPPAPSVQRPADAVKGVKTVKTASGRKRSNA